MAVKIVENWLTQFVNTALEGDLARHMAMISRDVRVFGVPGFDVLEFDDWYRQCEHEFPQRLLADITYSTPHIRTADQERIMFKSLETSRSKDGNINRQAVEMLLQRDEGNWKLQQMRLLPDDEARHDGLL
jgi:hypothetical protein